MLDDKSQVQEPQGVDALHLGGCREESSSGDVSEAAEGRPIQSLLPLEVDGRAMPPSQRGAVSDAMHFGRPRKTIQDLLLREGMVAVRLAVGLDSAEVLQDTLARQLGQNSQETRARYAQSILRWFFPDGVNGLATRVWAAYQDVAVETDFLRYLYLSSEPVMGACVSEALFPLEEGMQIPADYFDRFLRGHFGGDSPAKTRKRLKSNLMHLGFLARAKGKPDRLCSVASTKTAFLILVHHLFAPTGVRTVEVSRLLSNPFWKYLGYKSEDTVRQVLREADAAGLLGKYVVADQLEQVTTCMTLDEMLARKVRL